MAELTPERKAELLAYCKIDLLEESEALLIPMFYSDAVGYMSGAGVSIPQEGTDRRAQYDLCVNSLVLDSYEHRGATVTGPLEAENPTFRKKLNQLKFTEPVPNLGTGGGE